MTPLPPNQCIHCGDGTEQGDDPFPTLCAMCEKAHRGPMLLGTLAHKMAARHDDTVNTAVHVLATYAYAIGVDMSGPLLPISVELTAAQVDRLVQLYDANAL